MQGLRPEVAAQTWVLTGREGSGRSLAAGAVCRELGIPLLRIDIEAARGAGDHWIKLLTALLLEQRLRLAGVYFSGADAWFDKEGMPLPEAYLIVRLLARARGPIFLAFKPGTRWKEVSLGPAPIHFEADDPDYATRWRLWREALAAVEMPG